MRLCLLLLLLVVDCRASSPLRSGRDAFTSGIRTAAARLSVPAVLSAVGLLRGASAGAKDSAPQEALSFKPLPYSYDALEPFISKKTNEFHHDKHYQGYVKKALDAVAGTPLEGKDALAVMRAAKSKGDQGLFNNAAQVFNHEFYWTGMKPNRDGADSRPAEGSAIYKQICASFSSFEEFQQQFAAKGNGLFGSGWTWLVKQRSGGLSIVTTSNAEVPGDGATPLLTMDVWEHAYYLDRQNARAKYTEAFIGKLVDWQAVEERLKKA